MNSNLSISFAACLVLLVGCNDQNDIVESEGDINRLIENNIKDNCIYQALDPSNNISFNTVNLIDEKNTDTISIEKGNTRLLKQATALEEIGLLTKSSNHLIKNKSKNIYFTDSYSNMNLKNNSSEIERLEGAQFKITFKGKEVIKRLYESDKGINLCIGATGVGNINMTQLTDTKFKVLAELTYQNSFDWVSNQNIVEAFGDLTEGVYDNSLAGLIEVYLIKTKNGFILENGRLNTVK